MWIDLEVTFFIQRYRGVQPSTAASQNNFFSFSCSFSLKVNPFTPKSDQLQSSPAASPEILHHAVGRTWLSNLLRWKMIILPILTTSLIHFSFKGLENILFKLKIDSVFICTHTWFMVICSIYGRAPHRRTPSGLRWSDCMWARCSTQVTRRPCARTRLMWPYLIYRYVSR